MTADPKTPSRSVSEQPSPSDDDAASDSIVVDLGKGSRKALRKLRKGKEGKLMNRVTKTVDHLRESGQLAPEAQVLIVVFRERPQRRRPGGLLRSR